ncbi:hypothetical protein ACJBCE_36500 [Streptomyces sp. NBUL23]|uniref:hypothetical protein n=1 Tax=Streptomyces sp. NBUL23 TaxID=3381354 RepID=UPI00387101C6
MGETTYPLVYTDEEGSTHKFENPEQLALGVEFVDDWDRTYDCRDASGRRIRLIVWALEVVLTQIVPDGFDPTSITVRQFKDGAGITFVEYADDTAMRSLRIEPNQSTAIEGLPHPAPVGPAVGSQDPRDFHRSWMRSRLGNRYP